MPAVLRSDGSPVTLLGDYAIVHALRSHPATLVEVRVHHQAGRLDTESRWYLGAGPNVILQEMPGPDGRLGFTLCKSDAGLIGLARVCGIVPEELQTQPAPPSRPQVPADEARQGWRQWVDLGLASHSGNDVSRTTLVVGLDAAGLWVIEADDDPAQATWTGPNALGERLASLLSLPSGSPSWLPRDPDLVR